MIEVQEHQNVVEFCNARFKVFYENNQSALTQSIEMDLKIAFMNGVADGINFTQTIHSKTVKEHSNDG